MDSNEWTTLFNGQLDERNVLDPMIGVQHAEMSPKGGSNRPYCTTVTSGQQQHHQRPAHIDRWLVEETHKLERQQRLQQQKLLELQQVLFYSFLCTWCGMLQLLALFLLVWHIQAMHHWSIHLRIIVCFWKSLLREHEPY